MGFTKSYLFYDPNDHYFICELQKILCKISFVLMFFDELVETADLKICMGTFSKSIILVVKKRADR